MDKELKIEYINIEELNPYEKNARINKRTIPVLEKSINEYGFKNPIIIDQDNTIIAGHTRLIASKNLGYKKVPVIKINDLTPAQIKAFRVMDNKVQEYSKWDIDLLSEELNELKNIGFDLDLTGLREIEAFRLLEPNNPTDAKSGSKEPIYKVKKGDIYQLGPHLLMCGDSTNPEDIKKVMEQGGGEYTHGIY